jgi:dienelactone hydrolase
MKRILHFLGVGLVLCLVTRGFSQNASWWGNLKPGPHGVGFRLMITQDASRSFPDKAGNAGSARTVRVYLFYPTAPTREKTIAFEAFARMAADDFGIKAGSGPTGWKDVPLPVGLAKGMSSENIEKLMNARTASVANAKALPGPFPLLVVGQGLYFESPLTHLVLCEYLASHGYAVVTCPLLGTQYRLVNLNPADLETQVRDMEWAILQAKKEPFVHPERLGVIGYDMGGMAGIVLTMRNPDVDAYMTFDAAVFNGHFSGLPNSHPNYSEVRFHTPWMIMAQARFLTAAQRTPATFLPDRKAYGDNIIAFVNTESHGAFTSYSAFGITNPVPAYWGSVGSNLRAVHDAVCQYTLAFFNAYLRADSEAKAFLAKNPQEAGTAEAVSSIEFQAGKTVPPPRDGLVHLIISNGVEKALPEIEKERAAFPDSLVFDENALNWLGYHFLYWWGRENDAVRLFELMAEVYPKSANAHDSLGEAYLTVGNREKAIEHYRKSLELDPNNQNAKAVLTRLGES